MHGLSVVVYSQRYMHVTQSLLIFKLYEMDFCIPIRKESLAHLQVREDSILAKTNFMLISKLYKMGLGITIRRRIV